MLIIGKVVLWPDSGIFTVNDPIRRVGFNIGIDTIGLSLILDDMFVIATLLDVRTI